MYERMLKTRRFEELMEQRMRTTEEIPVIMIMTMSILVEAAAIGAYANFPGGTIS